jgi:hypothetical protein
VIYHLGHIPVSLIRFVLDNKYETYFRTFLILKYRYTNKGFFYSKNIAYQDTSDQINISDRTFRRHLKKLVHLGFMGMDKKGSYYLRSYKHLRVCLKLPKSRKVEISIKELKDKNYVPYLFAAAIGYIALQHKFAVKREELKKDGLCQSRLASNIQKTDYSCPLSNRYLEYFILTSKGTIHTYLRNAKKLGYISFKEDVERTDTSSKFLKIAIKAHESGNGFPISINGKLCFRNPDRYEPTLSYKRIRK